MVTIEETIISPLQQRAIDYCDKKQMPKIGRQIAVIAYMHGATEQDKIARQEERERCVKVIRKMVCGWCLVDDAECDKTNCRAKDLRKAMEGGEE